MTGWPCCKSLRLDIVMGELNNGGHERNEIWHKGSLGDEDGARISNTSMSQRKHVIAHSMMKSHHNMTSVVVMELCNQPEAFTSDLGGNQSHYLCCNVTTVWFGLNLIFAPIELLALQNDL